MIQGFLKNIWYFTNTQLYKNAFPMLSRRWMTYNNDMWIRVTYCDGTAMHIQNTMLDYAKCTLPCTMTLYNRYTVHQLPHLLWRWLCNVLSTKYCHSQQYGTCEFKCRNRVTSFICYCAYVGGLQVYTLYMVIVNLFKVMSIKVFAHFPFEISTLTCYVRSF